MIKPRLWHWRGVSLQGGQCTGTIWAQQKADVVCQLQQHGICPLTIRQLAVTTRYWRTRYRLHFIRQLATLLQAGIPLSDGLMMMAQQHPLAQWQALAAHLARRLQEGISFAEEIRRWPAVFPALFTALLRTAELTGKLDECCLQLAEQQERQWQLQQKVSKTLRYPAIMLVIALIITVAMLGFVLPEFAAIYQSFNAPLPRFTRGLLAVSRFFTEHSIAVLILTLLSGSSAIPALRRKSVQRVLQKMLRVTPLIKPLIQAHRLSQIYSLLALCQQAGLPLLQGLDNVISTLSCPLWQQAISRIRQKVTEGTPLWQAISEEKLFTGLCRQLIHTGEITGTLDLMLGRLAHWHGEQAQQQADRLAAALEPAIMLIIGGLIGALVIALYLPVFQLGDVMSG